MLRTLGLDPADPELMARLSAAARLICFLDYDGTLAPIVPTPATALPLPGTAELLRQLVAAPGVLLALVSGRTVADLRRLLDIAGAYYIGVHGAEVCSPNGELHLAATAEACRQLVPELAEELRHYLAGLRGILLEDKGIALACHYRQASPADAAVARRRVEALAEAYQRRGAPLAVRYGHEVIEVGPAGANKGKAACAVLAAHAPLDAVLYIGDDRTDEDAFKLLPTDAVTVRVGSGGAPTRARYQLADPVAVRDFLRTLLSRRAAPDRALARE